jgi:hypothetical protein
MLEKILETLKAPVPAYITLAVIGLVLVGMIFIVF